MTTEQKAIRGESRGRLAEAEGLFELVTVPATKLGLSSALRRRVAKLAIRSAVRSTPPAELQWRRDLVIGQCLRLLGAHKRAIKPLLSSVRRHPEQRDGWVALGWSLKRLGKIDRAAGALAKAITFVPDDAVLHYNFACYLSLLGQIEMAVAELLWALDLNPRLRGRLATERDFEALRVHPTFQMISQTRV